MGDFVELYEGVSILEKQNDQAKVDISAVRTSVLALAVSGSLFNDFGSSWLVVACSAFSTSFSQSDCHICNGLC